MYKGIICYDGTLYFGWQKTMTGPSIQEELEKAIFQITQEQIKPEGASRTDRGVHAEGQVIQFALKKNLDPQQLQRGLNAVLPHNIRVLNMTCCDFHPTLDAIGKEYHYHFSFSPVQDPTRRLYSWHIHYDLAFDKMEEAAQLLIGTHDFSAFANEPEKDPICTIESIEIQKDCFKIKGNRFLYKMVRNLVGTLVYVGCDKISDICEVISSRDRKKAGITAPALGLYLHQVFY